MMPARGLWISIALIATRSMTIGPTKIWSDRSFFYFAEAHSSGDREGTWCWTRFLTDGEVQNVPQGIVEQWKGRDC
jgi:hypothetical protein